MANETENKAVINALGAKAAYNLANVTKTKPQFGSLTPKWLTKFLEFKGLETGIYRVNKVVEGETPLDVLCSQTKKSDIIPQGYVEYETQPREYVLNSISTIININTTIEDVQLPAFHFAIQSKTTDEFITNVDGGIWIETIPVENGYQVNPENEKEYFLYKAVFVNVQDDSYNIWEVDENGQRLPKSGAIQGKVILKDISTEHAGGSDNNGQIDQNQWNDVVGVYNTYEKPQIEVSVTKLWDDDDNENGTRPLSLTIYLLADGQTIDSRTITADDNWQCVFTELDQYNDQGEEIVYDVEEETIKGYELKEKIQESQYSFIFINGCDEVPETSDLFRNELEYGAVMMLMSLLAGCCSLMLIRRRQS